MTIHRLLKRPVADGPDVQIASGLATWPANVWAPGTHAWRRGATSAWRSTGEVGVECLAGEVWIASFRVTSTEQVDDVLSFVELTPRALARLTRGRRARVRAGDVAMAYAVSPRAAVSIAGGEASFVLKALRKRRSLVFRSSKVELLRAYFAEEVRDRQAIRELVLDLGSKLRGHEFAQVFYAAREAFDTAVNLSAAVNHFLPRHGDLVRRLVQVLDESHRLGALSRLELPEAPRFVAASALGAGPRLLRALGDEMEIEAAVEVIAEAMRPNARGKARQKLVAILKQALTAPTVAGAEAGIRAASKDADDLLHRLTWSALTGPWFTDQ